MKARYGSRTVRTPARIVKGPGPDLSLVAQRLATIPEFDETTHGQCAQCGRVIPLRQDGTLKGHRSRSTIPCIGATSRVNGVDH